MKISTKFFGFLLAIFFGLTSTGALAVACMDMMHEETSSHAHADDGHSHEVTQNTDPFDEEHCDMQVDTDEAVTSSSCQLQKGKIISGDTLDLLKAYFDSSNTYAIPPPEKFQFSSLLPKQKSTLASITTVRLLL